MNWWKDLRRTFSPPSAEEMAVSELQEARRELLKAHSGLEYASAMVEYHKARIARLQASVKAG